MAPYRIPTCHENETIGLARHWARNDSHPAMPFATLTVEHQPEDGELGQMYGGNLTRAQTEELMRRCADLLGLTPPRGLYTMAPVRADEDGHSIPPTAADVYVALVEDDWSTVEAVAQFLAERRAAALAPPTSGQVLDKVERLDDDAAFGTVVPTLPPGYRPATQSPRNHAVRVRAYTHGPVDEIQTLIADHILNAPPGIPVMVGMPDNPGRPVAKISVEVDPSVRYGYPAAHGAFSLDLRVPPEMATIPGPELPSDVGPQRYEIKCECGTIIIPTEAGPIECVGCGKVYDVAELGDEGGTCGGGCSA